MRALIGCLVVLAVALGSSNGVSGYTVSDYMWYTHNGHQYAITKDYGSWASAEAEAQAIGYHLATVNDSQENAWLSNTFKGYYSRDYQGIDSASFVWIGLKNVLTTPEWADGEPVNYTAPIWSGDWSSATPPYAYLHTATHFQPETWWNSPGDSYPLGVIETPEPSALALLGVGIIGLLGYALRCRKRAA